MPLCCLRFFLHLRHYFRHYELYLIFTPCHYLFSLFYSLFCLFAAACLIFFYAAVICLRRLPLPPTITDFTMSHYYRRQIDGDGFYLIFSYDMLFALYFTLRHALFRLISLFILLLCRLRCHIFLKFRWILRLFSPIARRLPSDAAAYFQQYI